MGVLASVIISFTHIYGPGDKGLATRRALSRLSYVRMGARRDLNPRPRAFQGATPRQAFFVKCDSTSTTQAGIDIGIVNIHVGFAPLKPAEFLVISIQQIAGQSQA